MEHKKKNTDEIIYYHVDRRSMWIIMRDAIRVSDKGIIVIDYLRRTSFIVCWEQIQACQFRKGGGRYSDNMIYIRTFDAKEPIGISVDKYRHNSRALCLAINRAYYDFKNKKTPDAKDARSIDDSKFEQGLINCPHNSTAMSIWDMLFG